jgi:tetratricopeptide (TPR) repeat protein
MLSTLKNLSAILLLLMHSAIALGQTDVDWYTSFFENGKQTQVEQELNLRVQTLGAVRQNKDHNSEIKLLNELGLLHLTKTFDYGQAMDFLIDALKLEDSLALSEQRVFTYIIMGKVFAEVSNFTKATELLNAALTMSSSSQPDLVPIILNELGKIDLKTGEVSRGRDYFRQVIEGQSQFKADALFNIANSLTNEGKYQQALQYHKQALALYRKQKDQWGEARSLSDIGELY